MTIAEPASASNDLMPTFESGEAVAARQVSGRAVLLVDVVETPDDVEAGELEPWFGHNRRLVAMRVHRLAVR
jgi:hypothetical protein